MRFVRAHEVPTAASALPFSPDYAQHLQSAQNLYAECYHESADWRSANCPLPTASLLPTSFIMSMLLFPFPDQPGLPASYEDMDLKKLYNKIIITAAQQPRSKGLFLLKMLLIKHQQIWNPTASLFSLVLVCFLLHFLKKCSL